MYPLINSINSSAALDPDNTDPILGGFCLRVQSHL